MSGAPDVVAAVRRHYGCEVEPPTAVGPEWAVLDEFTLWAEGSRIDLFAVRAWGGRPKGHERHAIEIKVARGDFLNEIRNPAKRAPFEAVSHRFWFATPKGLVDPDEIPAGCGLMEISNGGVRVKVKAPRNPEPAPIPDLAFVEAFRRASRSVAQIRWADANDPAVRVVQLERELASVKRTAFSHSQALNRATERSKALLDLARTMPVVCTCGASITPTNRRPSGSAWVVWRHVGEPELITRRVWTRDNPDATETVPCDHPNPDFDAIDLALPGGSSTEGER